MSGWGGIRSRYERLMTQLDEKLHQKNSLTLQLENFEKTTKIPRLRLVQVLLLIIIAIVIFTLGSELISNCVGFLYPAYASIKAIESLNKDDDTRWLTYWVVYGFFIFIESITDCFLSWFPFYWISKCIFLIWCMLPSPSNGSDFIYNFIIRPFFLKHQKDIDSAIDHASSSARGYLDNVSSVVQGNLASSRPYQDLYKEGYASHYDERDGSAKYNGRLGEIRQKYGGDQRMSPERSLDVSRARLFNEGSMRSGSRSPERRSGERRYSNERFEEGVSRSRKLHEPSDYNASHPNGDGEAYGGRNGGDGGRGYASNGYHPAGERPTVRKNVKRVE